MAELLVQRGRLVQFVEVAVHFYPLKALLAQLKELFAVLALPVTNDRGQQVGARAFGHGHHAINHILHLLRLDRLAGRGGIGRADARKKQAHIVIDLGNRPYGRAWVFRRGLLFNRDRWRQAADVIHIGFLHHIKELPRIGAERFHIASLPFGIDRIEREARFTRPGKPGNHHQLIARNVHVDVL